MCGGGISRVPSVRYLTNGATNTGEAGEKAGTAGECGGGSPEKSAEKVFRRWRLWGIDRAMLPKRTSTSAAPAMTQDAIRQLVADSVATALKAQGC
ncbi:hypothetical protein Tco_1311002 [Tanacetum coccineum]